MSNHVCCKPYKTSIKQEFICRAADAQDLWTVRAASDGLQPQTIKVLVRIVSGAACVDPDIAVTFQRQKQAARTRLTAGKACAKHLLNEPVIQPVLKQKRSR